MKFGHATNSRGVVGHPVGVTSIKDLFYVANGDTELAIREVASAGYSGVELFDGNLLEFPGGAHALKNLLAELRIALIAVYSGANFIFPEILDEELWRIERAAKMAAELGAEHLVVGGGAKRVNGNTDHDYVLLGQGLDRVGEVAGGYGLIPSFHPHLGTCVELADQVVNAMKCTRINLCPDTAHLAAGGSDNRTIIQTYADRIKYVHLKDYLANPFGFVPLGEGQLDFFPIVQALQEIGYDGWITVETDGYPGDPQASAQKSRQYLDKLFIKG
ncbi:MAG TPA: sugar phosphate isomerase/epimerase family protein [Atribacteraceae bacterium]|nr:sugar phosphate isomerase/epimerase family protein [Atribacteraceae bacterium]